MSNNNLLQSRSEMNSQIVPVPEAPNEGIKDGQGATLEEKLQWITDKVPLKEGNIMGSGRCGERRFPSISDGPKTRNVSLGAS